MKDVNKITKGDMALIPKLLPYSSPENIPLTFKCGDKVIKGIPEEFKPTVTRRLLDCNLVQITITGKDENGLTIQAEYLEYRDFPVTEWVAYITNKGVNNSSILSEIKIINNELIGTNPVLIHGNGDTCGADGYEFFTDNIRTNDVTLAPLDGTSCNGAFPYMRLMFEEYGINIAIGWPAQWEVSVKSSECGAKITAGQQRTYMYLKPGETIRTPRINFMGFTGSESRGRNIWRRWYFKHILPKENGNPIPSKLCLHTWMIDGKPEFTGITEDNQKIGISSYISRGMKPDIWWIDAGWYPCNFDWPTTGTWHPNYDQLPNGLGPVGKICDENDISLLLWFEPERVRPGTDIDCNYSQWLLHRHDESGNDMCDRLLNLGDKACCDWLISHVDKLIKESHIRIYRQDFNFAPFGYWSENEGSDRIGALENFHVQGYLRYWDELILRNPGLWIDSCASGGRRNDLETMRRAVPLHYTDVGYGNHPIKQKQYREMFEWIPYFRAHTMNWDNAEGGYENGGKPVDEFSYHCAMAPSITSMIEYNDSDELCSVGIKMHTIWREAAELMLSGDYYPLTDCRKNPEDFYSMQFDNVNLGKGFIQVVSNTQVKKDCLTVYPFMDENTLYHFENRESGETKIIHGSELKSGFTVSLPKRSGVIWFYKRG